MLRFVEWGSEVYLAGLRRDHELRVEELLALRATASCRTTAAEIEECLAEERAAFKTMTKRVNYMNF
ncbi:MAG: hypothetical protein U1D30_14970 [Planctomycetota bacterium]